LRWLWLEGPYWAWARACGQCSLIRFKSAQGRGAGAYVSGARRDDAELQIMNDRHGLGLCPPPTKPTKRGPQHEQPLGWFLRELHFYARSGLVVLLLVHVAQSSCRRLLNIRES